VFQSRAGFSECLDDVVLVLIVAVDPFQSRAGFSECLDLLGRLICLSDVAVSIPCWVF